MSKQFQLAQQIQTSLSCGWSSGHPLDVLAVSSLHWTDMNSKSRLCKYCKPTFDFFEDKGAQLMRHRIGLDIVIINSSSCFVQGLLITTERTFNDLGQYQNDCWQKKLKSGKQNGICGIQLRLMRHVHNYVIVPATWCVVENNIHTCIEVLL